MVTVTIVNQTGLSIFMPVATGGLINLTGSPGRLTFAVMQSDWIAFYADGQWLPALASKLLYATVNL